ncbi:MAG: tyrosine-type recombinase/integrase [Burkholderiaceae bacterium]|nr:tyrosine-type recombinase/integrase [Burkholderiaceae bacterium]
MKPHHVATDPIRDKRTIGVIKKQLADNPRDFALFTIGTNTAFRGSDILALNVGDVRHLQPGEAITRKEKKTGKRRMVTLNGAVIGAIQAYLAQTPDIADDEPRFRGFKRGTRLTIETLGRLTKRWCEGAGLEGSYSAHSMRKTWAHHSYKDGADLALIQQALNHSSQAQTLTYIALQSSELKALYMKEI